MSTQPTVPGESVVAGACEAVEKWRADVVTCGDELAGVVVRLVDHILRLEGDLAAIAAEDAREDVRAKHWTEVVRLRRELDAERAERARVVEGIRACWKVDMRDAQKWRDIGAGLSREVARTPATTFTDAIAEWRESGEPDILPETDMALRVAEDAEAELARLRARIAAVRALFDDPPDWTMAPMALAGRISAALALLDEGGA